MLGSSTVSTCTFSQLCICSTPCELVLSLKPLINLSGRCITSPPSTVAGSTALVVRRYSLSASSTGPSSPLLVSLAILHIRARPEWTTALSSPTHESGGGASGG